MLRVSGSLLLWSPPRYGIPGINICAEGFRQSVAVELIPVSSRTRTKFKLELGGVMECVLAIGCLDRLSIVKIISYSSNWKVGVALVTGK